MSACTWQQLAREIIKYAMAAMALILIPLQANAAEMTISAAASLTNAFNELATLFEKGQHNLQVHANYAASNPLLKQIVEGAPIDVFASADEETMNQAVTAKVVDPATRASFAINDLVLIVPIGNIKPASLEELVGLDKIAIGDPASVPAGRYARSVLENVSLWNDLANKLILGSNVRQVLEYVASGEVDAGIVYATDARQLADRVDMAMTLQTAAPISYPIAVATTGKNPEAGAAFVNFIFSEPAGEILKKYGFTLPKKSDQILEVTK